MKPKPRIAYFAGEPLGVPVAEALMASGITPTLVVASPDRPAGRTLELTPPPIKRWADAHTIPVFQPESLKDAALLAPLTDEPWDLFVVVAYNHIFPEWLIALPRFKTVNLHPSLLPLLRGPSPIRSALLHDQRDAVGVSVMLLDAQMDHGPLLAQEAVSLPSWPLPGRELDALLAKRGGALLATTIEGWLSGTTSPFPQEHERATYTKKFTKDMGELTIDPHALPTGEAAYEMFLRICALDGNPGTYFFHAGKRIKITKASLTPEGRLHIKKVIPEGKSEVDFSQWLS